MTTSTSLPDLLSPELIFEGWQEYLRGRELDLSHATAQSHDRWSLARAALRFKVSKAVLIKEISDIKKLDTLRPQPKPHQIKGLMFFWNHAGKRAYFADDVGLGKTKTAALILHQLIEHGYISKSSGRVLVLCPKAVIEKWKTEFESFGIWPRGATEHNGLYFNASHAGPWEAEAEHARFIVTTYNSLQQRGRAENGETTLRQSLLNKPGSHTWAWDLVILDEVHRTKNLIKPDWTLAPGTLRTRTQAFGAYQVANSSRFCVALSATPINNDLYELFSQSLVCQNKDSPFVEIHDVPDYEAANVKEFDLSFCGPDLEGKSGKRLRNHGDFQARLEGFLSRTTRDETREAIARRCVVSPRRLRRLVPHIPADPVRADLMAKYSKAKKETNRRLNLTVGGDPSLKVVTERAFLSSDAAVKEHLMNRKQRLQSENDSFSEQQRMLFNPTVAAIGNEERCIDEIVERIESGNLSEHPKLTLLKRVLERAITHCEKRGIRWQVVIYTFFKRTADCIASELSGMSAYSGNVLCSLAESDGQERARLLAEQFCYVDNLGKVHPRAKRILVATEALREGIDLHSANIVINYDLPWNPAFIEQRIGRLHRLNSPHRSIFVFNLIVPGARIEQSINDVLLIKARLINECFLSTYKFGVGEDEPDELEAGDDALGREQQTLSEILEGYLQAETESEREKRLAELGDLREKAEAQLREFKESEERAKRERPPDIRPTPEEILALERLEKLSVPEPLLRPAEFALNWWRKNGIFPGEQGVGRWRVPLRTEGWEYWAEEAYARDSDELFVPHSTRFLDLCSEPLNNCSVGFFNLESKNFDWRNILEDWLKERYPNLRLLDFAVSEGKPVQDWAAELPLKISHDWKKDGPDEIQPLLKVETAQGLYEQLLNTSEAQFRGGGTTTETLDEKRLIKLDSEIRESAKQHEDLKIFTDYYGKVLNRRCKIVEAKGSERAQERKRRLQRQFRPRLTLSPGVLMCTSHEEAMITIRVSDLQDRIGTATDEYALTACLSLGVIREKGFRCQQSKFYRLLDRDTLVITDDGKLVHVDSELRVCAETGEEYSIEHYANYLEICSFTGALFRKDFIRVCNRCGQRGWHRIFATVGKAGELLCPSCYQYSNGREKPAAPEEFRICPETKINDTEEFFIGLDDGTDRLVHQSVVEECDFGPRRCLKADVIKSDVSGRTAHVGQFLRGVLSGKNLLPDDPYVIKSPSGRIDTNDNFSRCWTDDEPYLTDELGFCSNCRCHVPLASVAAEFCDFCKPKPKEHPREIPSEIRSLIPAEAFEEEKRRKFSAIIRRQGHALLVVVHTKPHVLISLLSVGFIKPKPIHSFTFFREHDDQHWVLAHSTKSSE